MSTPWPNVESTVAVITSVTVTNVLITLLVANPKRVAFKLSQEGIERVYVQFGPSASAALHTFYLDPGDYYESLVGEYNGEISAISVSDNFNDMKMTEEI